MTKDTRTRAQRNRAVRQEALREQLEAQGHVQYVVECIENLKNVEPGEDAQFLVNKHKTAAELHLKLVGKYLPDLKQVEADVRASVSVDDLLNSLDDDPT